MRPHSVPISGLSSPASNILPPRGSESVQAVVSDYHSQSTTRPKAPLKKHSDTSAAHDNKKSKGRRRRNKTTAKYAPVTQQSLDESFACLDEFEKHNRGRDLSSTDDIKCDDLHFVNIEDSFDSITNIDSESTDSLFTHQEPIHTLEGGIASIPSTKFEIPELPAGKRLTINILSTWGDSHYIGLMGIEVFDRHGHSVTLSDVTTQLSADPACVNDNAAVADPRTIDKVVDGHFNTSDELHSWLAPFTAGNNHYIYMDFDSETTISMIRIWNYNTSRIHSYRGARYAEISLDNNIIFKGEIRKNFPFCVNPRLFKER